ncbi:cutinase family protein [Ancrocorticia populi]|uniref:cutinase family protein n=1 Tax=Ancrocorticia populi TaxID=2175228 RepID=UPI003F9DD668
MKARIPVVLVSCLSLACAPVAAAQTSEEPAAGVGECPAVHLVLVNGTFDTAPNVDPDSDHGFYASLASDALERANDGEIVERDNGIKSPRNESVEATTSTEEPSAVATTSPNSAWGAPSETASSTTSAPSGDSLWQVETTSPSVVDGQELSETEGSSSAAPATSASSQWPGDEESEENPEAPADVQRMARTYITYPASAGGAYVPGVHQPPNSDSTSYKASVETGMDNAKNVLEQIDSACPNTKVFISGYSQGAQVAGQLLRDIGSGNGPIEANKVAGGALLSDPTREEDSPLFGNGATAPAAAPGTTGAAVKQLGNLGDGKPVAGGGIAVDHSAASGSGFGSLNARVASYCLEGDLVCAMPVDSPLPKLATSVGEKINLGDPVGSLRAVAESLGPAVVLGGVESVADGVSFGNGGFQINRATNPNKTLLGRVSTEAARTDRDQGEMEQRLTASLSQIGGMALGAGITIAKKTVTAENLAQVAAAGVVGPQAAVGVAAAKLAEASLDLITPELAGGASRRVLDEVQAAGLNEESLTTVATQTAQWGAQPAHASYASAPVTQDGRTAAQATSDWAVALAADAVAGTGKKMPLDSGIVSAGRGTTYNFDSQQASDSVAQLLKEVQA